MGSTDIFLGPLVYRAPPTFNLDMSLHVMLCNK